MNNPMEIVEMFVSVNGEGDEIGRRTVFVRVYGCSANCPGCDTLYAKDGKTKAPTTMMHTQDVITFAKKNCVNHITFTGGEPYEQKDIEEWVDTLLRAGFLITIETNGINRPRGVQDRVHAVVSPKPWMLNDKNRDAYFYWARMGATFKFAGTPADVERIRKWYKIFRLSKAYIQPWIDPDKVDNESLNKAYLSLLEEVHKRFDQGEDIRVVPQFHKYVWGNKRGV